MDGIGLWEGLKSPGAMGGLQKKIGPFNMFLLLGGTPSLKEGIPAMKKRILETLIFLRDSPRLSGINNF